MNEEYTYRIIDLQTDELVASKQTTNDLRNFANELFWQDEVDFHNLTIEEVKSAFLGCDYDFEQEN